ncbi:MAG TPA: SH3 domain-containing protein [Woeseiaceae bacterium]|nr:SH3 domain-containing protein [Woeseiaceae bacterium]
MAADRQALTDATICGVLHAAKTTIACPNMAQRVFVIPLGKIMSRLSLLFVILLPLAVQADYVETTDRVTSYVNIRAAASASADVVGRLAKGDKLPLVDAKDDWLEVGLPDGGTGFVHSDWARQVADEQVADREPLTAAEPSEAPPQVPGANSTIADSSEPEPASVPGADSTPGAETAPADEARAESAAREPDSAAPLAAGTSAVPPPAELPVSVPTAQAPDAGDSPLKGTENFLVRFKNGFEGRNSQIFDDGNFVGIGTTTPKQRLEVNGSIQVHEQNSNVAGLMITQSGGDTGYILHNRANTLTIGAGSIDRITVDRDGNVGIGESNPSQPLQMASGAYVSAGGVWTNASSRAKKQDISELGSSDALEALTELKAVQFHYRDELDETYLGFIAEDVPELVAMKDRQSLSPMDIVAVLTKVVQDQQLRIAALEARLVQSQ